MNKKYIVLNSNTNRHSSKKNIRFEHEMIDKITILKGAGESFSNWVKQACLERIRREELGGKSVRPPNSDTVRTASIVNQDLVHLAKVLSAKGLFHKQIADTLNERGIKSPNGKVWNRRMISILLTRS